MPSFAVELQNARAAKTRADTIRVLMDLSKRLDSANSAIAVDSTRQILDALISALNKKM